MFYIIVGRRETGKTTLAYDTACRHGLRTVYDPRGHFHTSTPFEFLLAEDCTRDETIVMPEQDANAEFPAFCSMLKYWINELTPDVPRTIVIDEARFVKYHLEKNPEFNWLIRCTPRDQVNVIVTAHRPADVPVDVRAIADIWSVFRTTQEHDLKVFEERCGDDFVDQLRTLNGKQFMKWDDTVTDDEDAATPYLDPRVWYRQLRPVVPIVNGGEERQTDAEHDSRTDAA